MADGMRGAIASAAALMLVTGCLADPHTIGALSQSGGADGGGSEGATSGPGRTPTSTAGMSTGGGSGSVGEGSSTTDATGGTEGTTATTTGEPSDCTPQDAFTPSPYVWIPRGTDGVMLKYDAASMTEVGRYAMRPSPLDDSSRSRVSVNLNGDAVVSNRFGGISMFYGNPEDCPDRNGINGVQTSAAAEELLAWDEEECRGWHTEFQANSQRPVAWTSGVLDTEECRFAEAEVWTSRTRWEGVVQVFRLNGDDGSIVEMTDVPEMDPQDGWIGAYGGAVDVDNDFWIVSKQDSAPGDLCEITYEGLDVRCWPVPGEVMNYGFTLDRTGRAWVGGTLGNIARFDPDDEAWVVADIGGEISGVQEGLDGNLWFGADAPSGFAVVDPEGLDVVEFIEFAPGSGARGVAIDHLGQAWGFSSGGRMLRYRPSDGQLIDVKGVSPYVHSDNVGVALMLTALGG